MNLVAIAALIAVAAADKLDRAYLPPASAKTAGGSPGSLQTPFAGNSLNNGLGGIPKGSYSNEFQGVVVDAAAPGTRASGPEDSGLGAPRISYGSIDSRVGAAAFKVGDAGFRQQAGFGFNQVSSQNAQSFRGPGSERPRAAQDRAANTLRFESEVGPENYHYAFETDNGISAEENGVATSGVQAQGGYSYTGDDGQVYSVTYTADEGGYQPKGSHLPTPPPIPVEILKSLEQNAKDEAAGLIDDGSYDAQKYNAGSDYSESDSSNGKYSHQSKFGNKPEADATASGTFVSQSNQRFKPGQSRPGSLTTGNGPFGSGANGFGQSGISSQLADHTGSNANGNINGQFGLTSNRFGASGNLEEASSEGSGSGIHGQFEAIPNRFSSLFGQNSAGSSQQAAASATQAQFGSNSNKFGQKAQSSKGQPGNGLTNQFGHGSSNKFAGASEQTSSGQTSTSALGSVQHQSNDKLGSATSSASIEDTQRNGFGDRNAYLPPKNSFNLNRQNGRLQSGTPQRFENNIDNGSVQPHQGSSAQSTFNNFHQHSEENDKEASASNNFRPSATGNKNFVHGSQVTQTANRFGSKNEYLPPINSRPQSQSSSGHNSAPNSQFSQQYPGNTEEPALQPSHQNLGRPQSSFSASTTASGFEAQSSQQFNGFQKPQPATNGRPNNLNGNHFTSNTKGTGQNQFSTTSSSIHNGAQGAIHNRVQGAIHNGAQGAQSPTHSSFGFSSQHSTSQPDTELTTPLESSRPQQNGADSSVSQTVASLVTSRIQPANGRPQESQFSSNFIQHQSASHASSTSEFPTTQSTSRPQRPSFGQSQPSFNQNSQGQYQQSSFSQNNDAQYSSSTQRTSYGQQPQGSDDSYYYNQPSKPFNIPNQGSRFPTASSNQFDRVTQRPSQNNNYPESEHNLSPSFPSQSGQASGLTKYPRPPTFAPIVSESEHNLSPSFPSQSGQVSGSTNYPRPSTFAPIVSESEHNLSPSFPSQSGQVSGSTKYPRPPTFAPIVPTSSSQFQGSFSAQYNGITQASISPFPSESPTQSTQHTQQNQFGSKPQSSNQFSSGKPSFSQQQSTATPSFPQRFGNNKTPSFQGQTQPFGQGTLNQNQQEISVDTSESSPSQQYDGTIYEYKKPPQSLPAPDHQATTGSGQTGQTINNKFSGQFGQSSNDDNQSSNTNQFGQAAQGSSPQFGSQSSRPFSQNTQSHNNFGGQATTSKGRPQFGASRPFGSQATQFERDSDAEEEIQPEEESTQFVTQDNNGIISSACCKSQLDQDKPNASQFGATGRPNQNIDDQQSRFGAQNSGFSRPQSFKPTASSFTGKGEEFGGPRKPPSFDEKTGYHY